MISEDKILKAALKYADSSDRTLLETISESLAFKYGAHWALQEFKKSLWHDTSEKPTKSCNILFEYEKDKFYAEYHNKDKVAWQNIRTIRWCDIDDILPKEGGEE